MIASWAAWLLTVGIGAILGVGLYLLAWHRGYVAGRSNHIGSLPGDAWRPEGLTEYAPESQAEFMAELLDRERRNEPPRKYQREK